LYFVSENTHLRYPFRADEAARLDGFEACASKPVDKLDFDGDGDDGFFVLEAVARADFDDADEIGGSGAGRCRER
jgi:hypothetical protein